MHLFILVLSAARIASADPRERVVWTWSAPSAAGDPAASYDIRIGTTAPGADVDSWWLSATPQTPGISPGTPGSRERWASALPPGTRAWIGIKSSNAQGAWSAVSVLDQVEIPSSPFLMGLAPTEVEAGVPTQFTLTGLGMDEVVSVVVESALGSMEASAVYAINDTLLRASATLPRGSGPVTVTAYSPGGESQLAGWLQVLDPDGPPLPVTDLTAEPLDSGSVVLRWTAPQDPYGSDLVRYEIRVWKDGQRWRDGTTLASNPPAAWGSPESLQVAGLTPGTRISFGIRSLSNTGFWSPLSNVPTLLLPGDEVGPAQVTDFTGEALEEGIRFTWTNPEDQDAERFEMRRASSSDVFDWETAELMGQGLLGNGEEEVHTVDAAASGTWGVMLFDLSGNPSPVSNLWSADDFEDHTPPTLSGDLTLHPGPNRVQLRWRAPADDDSSGRAASYHLVVVENPDLFASWWEQGEIQSLPLLPQSAGKREYFNVTGITFEGVHGFALSALDAAGNRSPWITALISLEGEVVADTAPPAAPQGLIAYRASSGVVLSWTASAESDVAAYRVYQKHEDRVRFLVSLPVGTHTYSLSSFEESEGARYSVTAQDDQGNESATALWVEVEDAPVSPVILPAAGGWDIRIPEAALPDSNPPLIQVFDIQGRLVTSLHARLEGELWHALWDERGRSGGRAVPGVYFLRLSQAGAHHTGKILLRP